MTSSVQPSPSLTSRFLTPGVGGPRLGALTYLNGPVPEGPAGTELTVRMGVAGEAVTETWVAGEPVCAGDYAGLRYTGCRDFVFCVGRIEEAGEYAAATHRTYEDLFTLLARLGYKRLVRVWNYIGDINGGNARGQEVYRDFCVGRSHALEQLGMLYGMPATTVIGAEGDGIGIAVLAAREAEPVNIENPRQTPAYHYPPRYGPRSPNFARATYVPPADDPAGRGKVFVSGTASIVGHETVHVGDVRAQTHTALENIGLLIGPDNLSDYGIPHTYGLSDLRRAKVYVRHAEDVPAVREICSKLLPDDGDVVYLHADVCRGDLLMELEGVAD
ncbi:FkbO/Hyg5 family chorismatase [Streptomyces sp. NPDC005474]|uniref:FkbO/Hyg5 family chorismatase n=1 Tax=Streptomyces sp. NPDC005474 TaxID=3154878 RepID=UPI003451F8F0